MWTISLAGCPARHHPGGGQPAAGFLQSVVPSLPTGAGVLGPGLLPQRFQHGPQRRGAAGGQGAFGVARATESDPQPHEPVIESAVLAIAGLVRAGALVDLLRQPRHIPQFHAVGGAAQDPVGVVAGVLGEPAGPGTQVPGPRA
jgi:hypothetical protein